MKKRAVELLKKLSEAHGGSSGEGAVRAIFCNEIAGDTTTDNHGSVIHQCAGGNDSPRIMVEAHMDEVGFMIQSITSDGYLKFVELGGWWSHALLAQRVRILTRTGEEVPGIISCKPPHHLTADERKTVVKTEEMYIDIGADDAADVADFFGIGIGDIVVPSSEFKRLSKPDFLVGKAFDNRAGMALLVQIVEHYSNKSHPNTVVAVGSVQEEVGTRGAVTATNIVKPDIAIVLEGTPADDLPASDSATSQAKLGGGPQIRLLDSSAILHRPLADFAGVIAAELKIPHQWAVRRSGGTDAKVIQLHGAGVPTLVVGVPARYIHTHNSVIHLGDYLHTFKLVTEIINRFDDRAYTKTTDF